MCVIEDKTAVVVVASYRSVSRNPVCFKALVCPYYHRSTTAGWFVYIIDGIEARFEWSNDRLSVS